MTTNPSPAFPISPPRVPTRGGAYSGQTKVAAPSSIAFAIGCIYMFFLFSRASEFVDNRGRFHLMVIFAGLGFCALVSGGALPSMFAAKPGWWLTAFTGWLMFSLPFSLWKGGSFVNFSNVWLKSYFAYFLVGGVIFTVQQVRKSFFWMACASVLVMYLSKSHQAEGVVDDRFSVSYGSLGNANDLAGTMLIGLPFMVYVCTDKKRNGFLRFLFSLACLGLLGLVLKTGSRGGLVTITILLLVTFFKTSMANRAKLIVCGVVGIMLFPLVVSKEVQDRYKTILLSSTDSKLSANQNSALESTNARRELMKIGVELTLKHPLFGVGLGQFAMQSANLLISKGQPPMWFTSHDIYLLVAGETGLPGLVIYIILIVICFKTLLSLQKAHKLDASLDELSRLAYTVMISLTAFLVSGIFSTNAYTFQLPMLAALTAALERISRPLIAEAQAAYTARLQAALPVNRFSAPRAPKFSSIPVTGAR